MHKHLHITLFHISRLSGHVLTQHTPSVEHYHHFADGECSCWREKFSGVKIDISELVGEFSFKASLC